MEPTMPQDLSPDAEFQLAKYAQLVKGVSKEDLEGLFIELMRQKLIQEKLFREILKSDRPLPLQN